MEDFITIKRISLVCAIASIIALCASLLPDELRFYLYRYVAIFTFLSYSLFFWASAKDTDDSKLKTYSYISLASMICALSLSVVCKWFIRPFFLLYDLLLTYDLLEKLSVVVAFGLPAFYYALMKKGGNKIWIICIPAIAGMFLLGIQFTSIRLNDFAVIFIPHTLIAFSFYKLYEKL